MDKTKELTTLEEVKAMSDPFRLRIIGSIDEFPKGRATVKQIADKLGEVPAKVYYHVKKLQNVGILELVHTEEINGIVSKYYSKTAESFQVHLSEEADEAYKSTMIGETQRMITEIYNKSLHTFIAGTNKQCDIKKGDGTVSSTEIYVSEEEMKVFLQSIRDFLDSHEIKDGETVEGLNKYHVFLSSIRL